MSRSRNQIWVLIEDEAQQVYVTNASDPGLDNFVIFDTGDWDVPQRVLLTTVDDGLAEGPHETESIHTALDISTAEIIGQSFLPIHIADNDAGSVIITESRRQHGACGRGRNRYLSNLRSDRRPPGRSRSP